jgi:hypothetical protein
MANHKNDLDRPVLNDAERDFAELKHSRRIALIDLNAADLNPDRARFEEFLKARVAEVVVSGLPDRYRALWKSILAEAEKRFGWQPAPMAPRRVSLTPAEDAIVRHATRVLAMVHELHKAGYQKIRVLPYLAPSGGYWRCTITYAANMADDGFTPIRDGAGDREHVARYSTADGNNYFGGDKALSLSARELAVRFLGEFPVIAAMGQGRDWLYAGWLTDVLGRAEQGRVQDLLYLIADFELGDGVLRDWQPPPPPRD